MNGDNLFVNLNLMLKILCWLHNMCLNDQFDPFLGGMFVLNMLFL